MAGKSESNPLAEIRPGFITLSKIFGVSIGDKSYEAHPDWTNPKDFLREEVLNSLDSAKSPQEISPIEVFLTSEGKVVIIDGTHRVVNAVRKCDGNPEAPFGNIRVTRFQGTELEAKIRLNLANLGAMRGNLTEAEEVGVVERLRGYGLTPKQIIEKAGKGNMVWINRIQRVLDATPAVLEAVKKGEISLFSGNLIAKNVPVGDQAAAVAKVKDEKQKNDGDERQARANSGVRKNRIKTATSNAMFGRLWGIFEEVKNGYGVDLNETTEGEWNCLMFYFGFEKDDHDEVIARLEPMYDEYKAKQNAGPAPKKKKDEDDDE